MLAGLGVDISRANAPDSCLRKNAMDLTFPPEAESFRAEIRAFLEATLPLGFRLQVGRRP